MDKPTKYYSSKQEKSIAAALGWDVVTGSGARDMHPGDIIGPNWLGECKTHTGAGAKIRFDASVWKKICQEAHSKLRYPVLFVDDGSQQLSKTWCMYAVNLVSPSNWYPVHVDSLVSKVRTNFVVDEADLRSKYDHVAKLNPDMLAVITIRFGGQSVGIVPLSVFKEMFGE